MQDYSSIPGLTPNGRWDLPERLNMAAQAMDHPADALALIDLTGAARRDISHGELAAMVDGLARYLLSRIQPGDRVGVLLSQSPWCAAAHLAIWKVGAISVPLFKLFQHDALASRAGDAGVRFVLTDPEFHDRVRDGAAIRIDAARGIVELEGKSYAAEPASEIALQVQAAGGIVSAVQRHGQSTFDVLTIDASTRIWRRLDHRCASRCSARFAVFVPSCFFLNSRTRLRSISR